MVVLVVVVVVVEFVLFCFDFLLTRLRLLALPPAVLIFGVALPSNSQDRSVMGVQGTGVTVGLLQLQGTATDPFRTKMQDTSLLLLLSPFTSPSSSLVAVAVVVVQLVLSPMLASYSSTSSTY